MHKLIFLVLAVMVLGGCATMQEATAPNRAHLLKLSIGMSKADALTVMGTAPFVGYGNDDSGFDERFVIDNPYRSEIIPAADKAYEVIYYATDVKNEDHNITDDELTPLVFDEGKLIGWGWSFLSAVSGNTK